MEHQDERESGSMWALVKLSKYYSAQREIGSYDDGVGRSSLMISGAVIDMTGSLCLPKEATSRMTSESLQADLQRSDTMQATECKERRGCQSCESQKSKGQKPRVTEVIFPPFPVSALSPPNSCNKC